MRKGKKPANKASPTGYATLGYKHKAPYESLVEALSRAIEGTSKVQLSKPTGDAFSSMGSDKVSFDCKLYIKDLNWRPTEAGGKAKTIHVLVHAQEQISKVSTDEIFLSKSTVRVAYYLPEADKLKLQSCIHYDYNLSPVDDQHPYFHAQLDAVPVEGDGDINVAIHPDKVSCFKGLRIPTSDMTLSSVLLGLAADHLNPDGFKDFRDKILGILPKLPHPNIEALKTRLTMQADTGHFKSSHWYGKQ